MAKCQVSYPNMVEKRPKPIQLTLVLHTAVDYLYHQGAGIGILQRAQCTKTGIIKNQILPVQQRKYGIKSEKFVVENIETSGRAQMLALMHALGLAYGTIKRGCPKAVQVKRVTVFSDSPKVVRTINYHIKHRLESFPNIASTNDYLVIKRVITKVRRLSSLGLEVAIVVFNGKDKAEGKARTIAR